MNDFKNPFLDDETVEIPTQEEVSVPFAERRYTAEQKREMRKRKSDALAAGILLPGMKNPETAPSRKKITEKDLRVLHFLAKFRYATAHQIALIMGVTYPTANSRLKRLEKMNLINGTETMNSNKLWHCRPQGITILVDRGYGHRDEFFIPGAGGIDPSRFAHTLAVNQMAARFASKGHPIDLLVSEQYIERILGRVSWKQPDPSDRGYANENLRRDVVAQLTAGKIKSNEFLKEYPSLWVPTSYKKFNSDLKQVHQPDLIINKESVRQGWDPVSIAVEVELSDKSVEEYKKILRTYMADRLVYKKVFWYCRNKKIIDLIAQAAREISMPKDRISITLFKLPDGTPYRGAGAL